MPQRGTKQGVAYGEKSNKIETNRTNIIISRFCSILNRFERFMSQRGTKEGVAYGEKSNKS